MRKAKGASSGADRVKAHRLREKKREGEPLDDDDQAWLDTYPTEPEPAPNPLQATTGASASERIVHIEEKAAAVGNHPHPEAYAAVARAEGLRADTLLRIAGNALVRVNDEYHRLLMYILERNTALEDAHIQMLDTIKLNVLARVESDAVARNAQLQAASGEDSELRELLEVLKVAKELKGQRGEEKEKDAKRPKAKRRRPRGTYGKP